MFAMTVADSALQWRDDVPAPILQPDEVMIQVAFAGVNRADIYQKQGKYPPPLGASSLLGLEVSGVISQIGAEAAAHSPWRVGDAVCALLDGGGYGELVAVKATQLLPIPNSWSLKEAAALPETLVTSYLALVHMAHLRQGEILLIHGGASGVGTLAIQLAKCLGATVYCTVSSPQKAAHCLALGADRAIAYQQEDFSTLLSPQCVDVILDMVGGNYMQKNLKLLRRGGRMVSLAFQGGATAEINMASLLFQNLAWYGATLRSQPPEIKAQLITEIRHSLWHFLEQRRITPVMDSLFPLALAEKAHEKMQQNLNIGKIVLEV
jgi:putative PIG3 family NAD(P)H quinone oxidoreductase